MRSRGVFGNTGRAPFKKSGKKGGVLLLGGHSLKVRGKDGEENRRIFFPPVLLRFPISLMEHLVAAEGLAALGAAYVLEGKRLVLTNGCFDLLHTGHVRYLQQARSLGDVLVVAVNSDRSVRALKGPERPLNSAEDRAEVLAALRCVDHVTIFDDLRAAGVIRALRPALYAKGGDYTLESLDPVEREALGEVGAEIRLVSLVPGRSTTSILKRAGKSCPT